MTYENWLKNTEKQLQKKRIELAACERAVNRLENNLNSPERAYSKYANEKKRRENRSIPSVNPIENEIQKPVTKQPENKRDWSLI